MQLGVHACARVSKQRHADNTNVADTVVQKPVVTAITPIKQAGMLYLPDASIFRFEYGKSLSLMTWRMPRSLSEITTGLECKCSTTATDCNCKA